MTVAGAQTTPISGIAGRYRFVGLVPGYYFVRFSPPTGAIATLRNAAGVPDDRDSDADAASNWDTPIFPILWDTVDYSHDLGLLSGANVRIGKSAPAQALRGSSFTYTLNYANDGPALATTVQIVDTLPPGVTYQSASPAPTSRSGQTLLWNLGSLPPGQRGTIGINVSVEPNAPNLVTNNATISTSATGDSPFDNSSSATTTIVQPNVAITKSAPATAQVGTTFDYTLTYRNNGTFPAENVTVEDTLPVGVIYQSATPAPSRQSGQTLSWDLGTIAAGTTGTITIRVVVAADAPQSLRNTGSVSTTTPGDDPGDNTSTTTTLVQRPNVRITKSAPPTVQVGETLTFTLAYENNGSAAALAVVIEDVLPDGLHFESSTPSPSEQRGQTVRWNVGTLPAGWSGGTIVIITRVTDAVLPTLVNTGVISTATPGDDPADNRSSSTTRVLRPNVKVSKSGPTATAEASEMTYTLTYGNDGDIPAANVVLEDVLPGDVVFMAATPTPTTQSGQRLTWTLGTLGPGANGSITVRVRVNLFAASPLVNTASISTTTPGDNPADNTARWTTTVIPPPPPPNATSQFHLAIHSALDPKNGVYRSEGTTISWPAGEVLNWTPRVQLSLNGAAAPYPYGYRAKVIAWSYVSSLGRHTATDLDDMPGHPAGCRTRTLPSGDASGLDGCAYRYIGGTSLADTTEPTVADMEGQAQSFWAVGTPLQMRDTVYVYNLAQLRAPDLVVQVKVLVEVVNTDANGDGIADGNPTVVRSSTQIKGQTYTVQLVVPRTIK